MKKIFFCLLLLALASAVYAQEDDNQARNHSIGVNFFDYLETINYPSFGFSIDYQYAFTRNFGLSVSPHFSYFYSEEFVDDFSSLFPHTSPTPTTIENKIYNSGTKLGLFYRPAGNWLKGMYLGILIDLMIAYRTNNEQYLFGIGNGIEIGYQWVFRNGLTISLGGCLIGNIYYPLYKSNYTYLRSIYGEGFDEPISSIVRPIIPARILIGYSFTGTKQ